MTNVLKHQTAIWSELKDLCEQEKKHAADARALWPEIAHRMARLRKNYRSNEAFGAALVEHGIEYEKNDRAAFIWMGQLHAEVLEDAMARCQRRSPQTFRATIESWGDSYFAVSSEASENADPTPESPETDTPVQSETPESASEEFPEEHETEQADPPASDDKPLDKRMLIVKALKEDHARALVEHFGNSATRNMLGQVAEASKKNATTLAELVMSGRLGESNDSHMTRFSARVICPELPKEWVRDRIFDTNQSKKIAAILADADKFIAMRDAGCRTKAQCEEWWRKNTSRPKAIDVTVQQPVSGDAIQVHGKVIWPRPEYVQDADTYTRTAAAAMFHLWEDMNRIIAVYEKSTVGRGRVIANLAKWNKYIHPQAGQMLQEMALAQQSNPDLADQTSRLAFVNGDTL